MRDQSLLIQNADWILTMDRERHSYRNADLLIRGDTIVQIGRNLAAGQQFDRVLDARGRLLIPGMVNTHHHCSHTLVRNVPGLYSLELYDWLREIYGLLAWFDEESIYAATLGALGDLLKTGCTTSVDHQYLHPVACPGMCDAQIQAATQLGIRLHLMRGCLSVGKGGGADHVPPSLVESVDHMSADCVRVIEKYHNPNRGAMVRLGLAPGWLVYETEQSLVELRRLADCYGVPLHSHLADSRQEFTYSAQRHGCSPAEYADRLGYLRPGSFFAHCIQLSRSDVALLARAHVGVSHCPNSDMVLRSGVAKLAEFSRRQIPVGLGVDGSASNNLSSMIAELKSAYMVQKGYEIQRQRDCAAPGQGGGGGFEGVSLEELLYAATAGGAKVLGRDDVGYLAPGMLADLVLLDWSGFSCAGGQHDPVAAIVLAGDARMVDKVLVGGRLVVDGGVLQTVDEGTSAAFLNRCSRAVFRRKGQAEKK